MKFKWGIPQSADVVILDGDRESTKLLSPLLADKVFVTIESGALFDNVTPFVLIKSIWYFLHSWSLRTAYAAAIVSLINPKIVVTFIDNSVLFQRLANMFSGSMRFLAIQNGMRMLSRDNPLGSQTIYHSEFACFGDCDVGKYRKQGAKVEHYYPIGSLKDSYFRGHQASPPATKKFDLCLISQIKKQHYVHYPKTMESLDLLAKHLKQFCETHGMRICVAARRHPDGRGDLFRWETDWFRKKLGEHVQVIPNDPFDFTSYSLVDASRVSLALHSTLIHEGFGRGNRILSCNYTGDSRYDFPIPGPWRLSDPSYKAFENRLSSLLQMSDTDYATLLGAAPQHLIRYDASQPTHKFLQELISDAVEGNPAPFKGLGLSKKN